MAKASKRTDRTDPEWPQEVEEPVSELANDTMGASSPYGELEFPLERIRYEHPTTVINR